MTLVGAPDLHPGSSGEWVTYLQQLLEAADGQPQRWTVPITGHFDAATEHAVKAFQHFCGWPQDGRVDAQLWSKLYEVAQGMEETEETIGQLAGDEQAGHHGGKLDVGEEAGRHGWRAANLTFTIRDFKNDFHTGAAYLRLRHNDGTESDEAGSASDGTLMFHNIWIPDEGALTLYVMTSAGGLEHMIGVHELKPEYDTHLSFECKQGFEPVTVTRDDSGSWTDSTGVKLQAGVDLEIVDFGTELTASNSYGETHGEHVQTTANRPTEHMDIQLH